jgi:hypothetical protein
VSPDRLFIFKISYVNKKNINHFLTPPHGHLSMSIVKCHKERLYPAQDHVCIQRKIPFVSSARTFVSIGRLAPVDYLSGNAHLVHQNWYRISFTSQKV